MWKIVLRTAMVAAFIVTPLLAQPVAVAANGEDVAVMEQAVEDGGCHHGVAEHRSPLADRAIAGDQHAAPLVAPRDELEEQMCRIGLATAMAIRGGPTGFALRRAMRESW